MQSAKLGSLNLLTFLLEEIAVDVNARNHQGASALIVASKYGHPEILLKLISRKYEGFQKLRFLRQCGFTCLFKLRIKCSYLCHSEW
jgi:ankyrin repeat protein